MLHDGQPNLPYFFTWANEPWTRKFSGQAGEAGDAPCTASLESSCVPHAVGHVVVVTCWALLGIVGHLYVERLLSRPKGAFAF